MSTFQMPMSLASEMPTMSTLYSTSLLVAQKPHRMDCWTWSPSGEVRMSLMLSLFMLLELSTDSVHLVDGCSVRLSSSLLAYARYLGVKFAMKSAST